MRMTSPKELATEYVDAARTVDRLIGQMASALHVPLNAVFDEAMLRGCARALLIDAISRIYTVAELDAALAFLASPAGRSFADKQDASDALIKAGLAPILDACRRMK